MKAGDLVYTWYWAEDPKLCQRTALIISLYGSTAFVLQHGKVTTFSMEDLDAINGSW